MVDTLLAPGRPQPHDDTPDQPRQPARWWRSGWIPAALLTAGVLVTLHQYDVPAWDLARYLAFLAVCVTLPGMLIWRAVTRRAHAFVEDAAAGTALGLTFEVLTYIPARAIGLPLLVLAWPIVTLLTFALVPRLRGHWRPAGERGRAPVWHSWTMAVLIGLIFTYCTVLYFRASGLDSGGYGFIDPDSPWYLAMIGELRHHMPPMTPNLPDEGPVYYHWFSLAEMAATSWVTGIEPFILLRRLSVLVYLALLALLIPAIARRLTGQWWTGPVALLVSFFVVAPHPFGWIWNHALGYLGFGSIEDGSLLRFTLWYSPPQSFGAAIFPAAALLLIGLLSGRLRGPAVWLVFTALMVCVAGAKATYLPLLVVGLACAVAVGLLRRRVSWPAIAAASIALVCLAGSMFILLGGVASGLTIGPLHVAYVTGITAETGIMALPQHPMILPVVIGIMALCWACVWLGLIGLRRAGKAASPEILTFLGMGAAGVGGTMLLAHPGLSQVAFIQSARPYLSIAAVVGFAGLVGKPDSDSRDPRYSRRTLVWLCAAAVAGIAVVGLFRVFGSETMPVVTGSRQPVLLALAWPYAALAGLAVLAAIGLRLWSRTRTMAAALVVAALMGVGLEFTLHDRLYRPVKTAFQEGWHPSVSGYVSVGTIEAGRWIRDHSDPNDMIATNAHCMWPHETVCVNSRFGATAFSERRALLEGWGYNQKAIDVGQQTGVPYLYVPYWNPELLAINDAAFFTPSAQTIGRLRDEYGVRWLFVDRSNNPPASNLGEFAQLRFASGVCEVYEVPAA